MALESMKQRDKIRRDMWRSHNQSFSRLSKDSKEETGNKLHTVKTTPAQISTKSLKPDTQENPGTSAGLLLKVFKCLLGGEGVNRHMTNIFSYFLVFIPISWQNLFMRRLNFSQSQIFLFDFCVLFKISFLIFKTWKSSVFSSRNVKLLANYLTP